MDTHRNQALYEALALVAPGTPLREGIDRILQSNMGALIVIGDGPDVLSICSGGFLLDAGFTPQRLSELAKMDGAIILAADGSRIARANVHLVPDSSIPTSETGTRHRTAERVARQIARPVVTVSEEMSMVSIHFQGTKKTLEAIPRVLARSDQALQILGRNKGRLDQAAGNLSALEVEDLVTARDVGEFMMRAEMVRRISAEIRGYVVELGTDGRLVELQLDELTSGVVEDLRLVCCDYMVHDNDRDAEAVLAALARLHDDDSIDSREILRVLHLPAHTELDSPLTPRGHRLLSKIPRLSDTVVANVVEQFGSLTKLMRASIADLVEAEGVGEVRARLVKDGLARLAESSILDRYS